jgi:hypothetical protein
VWKLAPQVAAVAVFKVDAVLRIASHAVTIANASERDLIGEERV